MALDWWTLALQVFNFLVLVWLLQRFLYRPARRVIEERRAREEAALTEARRLQEEAAAKEAELEARAKALEAERAKLREAMRGEIESERERIMDEARREAAELLAGTRKTLEEERRRLLEGLKAEIAALATDLARRILEELRGPLLDEVFFARLERHLLDMAEAERRELLGAAEGEAARLRVVTATPAGEKRRRDWRNRLERIFGAALTLDFAEEPALVAGVELDFAATRLSFSLSGLLDRARGELVADVEAGS